MQEKERPPDESQLNLSYHTDTPGRHIPFNFNGSIGGFCWRRWLQLQFKFAGSQCCQAAPGKLFTWTPPFRVRSNLFFGLHYIIVNPFWDNRTNRRHSWAATEKPMNEFLAYRAIPALKRKTNKNGILCICGDGTFLESIWWRPR